MALWKSCTEDPQHNNTKWGLLDVHDDGIGPSQSEGCFLQENVIKRLWPVGHRYKQTKSDQGAIRATQTISKPCFDSLSRESHDHFCLI